MVAYLTLRNINSLCLRHELSDRKGKTGEYVPASDLLSTVAVHVLSTHRDSELGDQCN